VHTPGVYVQKWIGSGIAVCFVEGEGCGVQVCGLDLARQPTLLDLHSCHHIEAQEGEVVEVVVAEWLAPQVRVHETQATKPSRPAAQAADVWKHEGFGIADDDVTNRAFAREQHANLAS
jgi:hypothetical protein